MTIERKTYVLSRRDQYTIYDPALAYVGIKLLTVDGLQFNSYTNLPLGNREYIHDVSGGIVTINVESLDSPLNVNIIIVY